jgi:hypothetical protein
MKYALAGQRICSYPKEQEKLTENYSMGLRGSLLHTLPLAAKDQVAMVFAGTENALSDWTK